MDLVNMMLLQAQAEVRGQPGLTPAELERLSGDRKPKGHAIEVRVYAENPADDHKPAPGLFTDVAFPEGQGIRVDTWLERGSWVTPFFGGLYCSNVDKDSVTNFSIRPSYCQGHDIRGQSKRGTCANGEDSGRNHSTRPTNERRVPWIYHQVYWYDVNLSIPAVSVAD